jgi:uncharacterized protein YbgA (DUF1722 family)/uncharacterized protein YbbK (DUF523 family)
VARSGGASPKSGPSISSGASAASPPRPIWGDDATVRIGISTCLLGKPVRWDGGHKRDAFLTDQLGPFVEWVPVCPEVEIGMGVPRETIRLVEREGERRLVAERSRTDWTDPMRVWAGRRVRELEALDLCGYVLKKDSPTCGMERVRVWNAKGMAEKRGRGLYTEALIAGAPALPVEEEGRLADPRLRENWIERVFAYRRVRSLFAGRWTRGDLVAFHTAHKLQVLSHSPRHYTDLGRLVADAKEIGRAAVRERYVQGFMDALRHLATPRRQVNVLQHVLGYFRRRLDERDRRELVGLVEDYGRGLVPLIVPITLVRHHVGRLGVEYLAGQVYLEPHPKELMLRNRV